MTEEFFGVLSLKTSYGSLKKKPLYKCCYKQNNIYDSILIPYQQKHIGFYKHSSEMYVSFRKDGEFGSLEKVFGPVEDEEHFFQYQLSMHHLYSVQKQWKHVVPKMSVKDEQKTNDFIFTIDPEGSKDLDDGFSITQLPTKEILVKVYISNVPLFLEMNQCWENLTLRPSTVYLPGRNIPILRQDFANDCCSLREGTFRNCIVASFLIAPEKKTFLSFHNEQVFISKNFSYTDPQLLEHSDYKILQRESGETDSHKVVEYWMLQFNQEVGNSLSEGYIRSTEKLNHPFFDFIGKYEKIGENDSTLYHEALKRYRYAHASSPIRRLIDIYNLTFLQEVLGLEKFCDATLEKVRISKEDLDKINKDMTSIKKVQMRCQWIDVCRKKCPFESMGMVMSRELISCHQYRYMIFFPKEYLVKSYKTYNEYRIGDYYLFTFRYFPMMASWTNKIRIDIMGEKKELKPIE